MTDLIRALKGALDYTRLYRDQTFVIKLGGEVMGSPEALENLAVSVALLESLSIRTVVVHGGGPQATALSRKLGLRPELVAGRRVTTPEVLEVAKMVYAGALNVDLLCALRGHGARPVGISGIDGGLVTARRRAPVQIKDDNGEERTVDFGEVGDVEAIDRCLLDTLLAAGYVPVIASLAADATGKPLNINGDTLAEALASVLTAKKLIFVTGAPGLLRDPADPTSLVTFAGPEDIAPLLLAGVIRGGMRPKVEACVRAVANGVRRTHIIDGRVPDSLLIEVFTGPGCGTMIVGAKERDTYREQEL